MTRCPSCGDDKERIAQHWAMSRCGYPEIPTATRSVLDGLVLGGATVSGSGNNRHLTLGSTNSELIEWLAESLDWLCHGVRRDPGRDGRDAVHRCRTPAHPGLNRYERWEHIGEQAGRAPPDDFTLRPLAGRIWWALAGGLQWSGDHDSQRQGTFSAKADDKAAWIQHVLAAAGFDSMRVGTRVQLRPRAVDAWLQWIGSAVPGVEHKWARTRFHYWQLTGSAPQLNRFSGPGYHWPESQVEAAVQAWTHVRILDGDLTGNADYGDAAREDPYLPSLSLLYKRGGYRSYISSAILSPSEIKGIRTDIDLPQKELAEKLGMTQAIITQWESDIQPVSTRQIGPLRHALGLTEWPFE